VRTCNLKRLLKGLPGDENVQPSQLKVPYKSISDYLSEEQDINNRPMNFFQNPAPLKPYYTPKSPSDSTLVFESRFESGNL
jgi:hypothetical protein